MTDTTAAQPDAQLVHPFQQLASIDQLLLANRHIEAGNALVLMLEALTSQGWSSRDYSYQENHGDALNVYAEVAERAANQWRQVLMSGCDLTQLNLGHLLQNIYPLHLILMGTFQGHMDDVILAQHLTYGTNYTTDRLLRLLLAWCPASRVGIDVFQQYASAPELVLAHAIATVGGMTLVSDVANAARNRAIDLLIDAAAISDEVLLKFNLTSWQVLSCWMRCSYSAHPRKHRVKPVLMRLSQLWLQSRYGSLAAPSPRALKNQHPAKPLMVVPLESFGSSHAMYRCYAPILEQLKQDFYLVGMAATGFYDATSAALFDEFVEVSSLCQEGPLNLQQLAASIVSWQAAIIYYPSIGMVDWVLQLSQQRLAPVQCMTLGHPATSASPEIDYVLIDQELIGDQAAQVQDCFSEKVISVNSGMSGFRLPQHAQQIPPQLSLPQDGVIRIAIPSVAQKLSAGFIRCLQALEQACPQQVCLVFFLGERSLQSVACLHQLRRELKHIECHLQLPYEDYIAEINRCQLHACSFPFGGTNSLVDSLRQGVPILALEGIEPHARIDAAFVRQVGLPEAQICHSEEEYQQRLIDLVQSPQQLLQMQQYLLHDMNMDECLLQGGQLDNYRKAFSNLLAQEVSA